MTKGLLTTAVGSYPKPDYITKARSQFARGELAQEELEMYLEYHYLSNKY